ncbi:MAG: InlB B-repeat-containing protein [Bacteroidaceae bacterium]|nr:InlB B-repeat-containing protein [Bacteroidaceae bacterium]
MKLLESFKSSLLVRLTAMAGLVLAAVGHAAAEDKVYIEDFSIKAGETKEIAIHFDTDASDIKRLKGTLTLPEGLTCEANAYGTNIRIKGNTDRTNGALLAYNPKTGAVSVTGATFSAGEDAFAYITVTATSTLAQTSEIALTGFTATKEDNSTISVTSLNANVTLDGQGGQGGDDPDPTPTTPAIAIAANAAQLSVQPGEAFNVEISLTNNVALTAFQAHVAASEGLTIESVTKGYRISGNMMFSAATGNIAMLPNAIAGEDGALFTIALKAADDFAGEATLTVDNFYATTATAQSLAADAISVGITVGTPPTPTYTVAVAAAPAAGGSATGAATVEAGQPATVAATPATGYAFTGWEVDGNVVSTDATYTFTPEADVTLTARFALQQFTVTFIADGTIVSQQTLDYGSAITTPATPVKPGYVFAGWTPAVATTVPAADVTYTAVFTEQAQDTYTLRFVVEGYTYAQSALPVGADIELPINPTPRPGYTFQGWGTVPATMPAHDVTLTAQFTQDVYVVLFTIDGQPFKSFSATYGQTITTPVAPEREGCTFSGWASSVEVTVTHDATYVGIYEPNMYRVAYYIDDQLYAEDMVAYGSPLTLRTWDNADPARYTFSGWQGTAYDTMPAHDIEYRATVIDAITGVSADKAASADIYSLDGRRLDGRRLTPGVYIIGGKKIVMK